MNRDPYANALNSALSEIKNAYPDITHSFLFTKTGSIITGDQETDEETMNNILESFQVIKEKANVIGNLTSFQINGKNGKLTISNINDTYIVLATAKNADKHIHTITHTIIPTIMKSLEAFSQPQQHLQPSPPKELTVDTFSGFFAGDSVQLDTETLLELATIYDPNFDELTEEQKMEKIIEHVKIETFRGKSTLCKVKEINDPNLKRRNMIRIPEKVCNTLQIKSGDKVTVKPVV